MTSLSQFEYIPTQNSSLNISNSIVEPNVFPKLCCVGPPDQLMMDLCTPAMVPLLTYRFFQILNFTTLVILSWYLIGCRDNNNFQLCFCSHSAVFYFKWKVRTFSFIFVCCLSKTEMNQKGLSRLNLAWRHTSACDRIVSVASHPAWDSAVPAHRSLIHRRFSGVDVISDYTQQMMWAYKCYQKD